MDIDIIRQIVDDRLRRVNTCIPGKIQTYDAAKREAEIVPQVDDVYAGGETLRLPVLTGVPLVQISTGSAGLVLPVAPGDFVLVLFAQRSIDRWLSTGNRETSGDERTHAMSDAIAIAGLQPFNQSHSDGDGVVVFNDQIKMRMDGNKVAIGTVTVELLDEITKALDDIVTGLATIPYTATITTAASTAIKSIKGII